MNPTHSNRLIEFLKNKMPNAHVGAEIGTWRGRTARRMLKHYPHLTLICVDVWERGKSQKYSTKEMIQVHVESMRSLRRYADRSIVMQCPSVTASQFIQDNALDFVFIDAAHDYQSVLDDINAWAPKVRIGGIVSGHDYNGRWEDGCKDVKNAVTKYTQECDIKVGVKRSIDVWWYRKEN